jgi:nicotinamidase-related amidase
MSLVTPRRALVVIDVQNEYVTGNLPIEYPAIDSSLPRSATRWMPPARTAFPSLWSRTPRRRARPSS